MFQSSTQCSLSSPATAGNDFTVLMLDLPADAPWRPRGPSSVPALTARSIPADIAQDLAVALNQRSIETNKLSWYACVAAPSSRFGVARVDVPPDAMPSDPHALPPTSTNHLRSRREARDDARSINSEILKTAIVPRRWGVVVRSLKSTEGGVR